MNFSGRDRRIACAVSRWRASRLGKIMSMFKHFPFDLRHSALTIGPAPAWAGANVPAVTLQACLRHDGQAGAGPGRCAPRAGIAQSELNQTQCASLMDSPTILRRMCRRRIAPIADIRKTPAFFTLMANRWRMRWFPASARSPPVDARPQPVPSDKSCRQQV